MASLTRRALMRSVGSGAVYLSLMHVCSERAIAKGDRTSSITDPPTSDRSDLRIDLAPLEKLAKGAARERPWLDSLLVILNGQLVFERYFNGMGPDDLHAMHSVTKQWLSCLVGIALDKGLLRSIDTPVADFFQSRIPADCDPRKLRITLRDCLSMQSGLEWRNNIEFATAFARSPDPVRFVFGDQIGVVSPPGTTWVYSAADSQMVAESLRVVIGRSLYETAREWLAEPLGIVGFQWSRKISLSGAATWPAEIGASELSLRPRDLARLGYCILQHGQVGHRQVIPREWIKLATTPTPGVDRLFLERFYASINVPPVRGMAGYGLHFGLKEFAGHPVISLQGSGGQYAFVIRDLDLVVVQTANLSGQQPQAGLAGGPDIVLDVILPALV